ncbi:hypothetical protein D3C72_1930670 [compost metagenome]
MLIGERLADKVGDARLDRLNHILLVTTAGHHDERQGLHRLLLSAPGQQLQPGHFRHFPVAQDQVKGFASQQSLGLAAVDRVLNDNPREIVAQALLHQVANERRIIHNQHTDFTHRHSY